MIIFFLAGFKNFLKLLLKRTAIENNQLYNFKKKRDNFIIFVQKKTVEGYRGESDMHGG